MKPAQLVANDRADHGTRNSPSTIGRELKRNSLPKAGYKPAAADHMAFVRRIDESRGSSA